MNALLLKFDGQIKAIARGLGQRGIFEVEDIEQEIRLGICGAYRKQPTATDSYLLQAGKDYARDKIKTETRRTKLYDSPTAENGEGEECCRFDFIAHPNRKGRTSEIREWVEFLKNSLTYRQIVIVDLSADGYTLPEIAVAVKWNLRTVQRDAVAIRNEAQDIGNLIIDGYEAPEKFFTYFTADKNGQLYLFPNLFNQPK